MKTAQSLMLRDEGGKLGAAGAKKSVALHPAEWGGAETGAGPARAAPVPSARQGSSIGQSLTAVVKQLDSDLLEATEGRLDLGTLATFGFLTAGAAEVVTTRQLPVPPWFNLAWWAFRTFTEFERPAGPASPKPARLVPLAGGKARERARSNGGKREGSERGRRP